MRKYKCALLFNRTHWAELPKVLKNKKTDGVGIKTGLCPDAIQRRNRWSAKPKAVGI